MIVLLIVLSLPAFMLGITRTKISWKNAFVVLGVGEMADFLTTYFYAKVVGITAFLSVEQNPLAKKLVEQYGLNKGLFLTFIHFKRIGDIVLITIIVALIYLISSYFPEKNLHCKKYSLRVGLLSFGLAAILTSVNNFLALLTSLLQN
ncbi:MAG: hypothetical protein AAB884_02630 [Patescibacteria group bacterium]